MAEAPAVSPRRLVFLQYNGDYAEIFRRLNAGGPETYGNQRYVVDMLLSASKRFERTWLVTHQSDRPFSTELTETITAVGLGVAPHHDPGRAVQFLDEVDPTDIIVHFPFAPVLRWQRPGGVRTLALLADSFNRRGARARLRRFQLARDLNRPTVTWVGNHGQNAARALTTWGVHADKVLAWDYPREAGAPVEPRHGPAADRPTLVYVGLVCFDKGVDCLLDACAVLRNRGCEVRLQVIGDGDLEKYAADVRRMRLDGLVRFSGRLPHDEVEQAMRMADAVVVPSLHHYGEGFPLTALEALTLRTPIAASDHPMFRRILVDGDTAVVHRAGDPLSLARSIERLLSDPALYRRISERSEVALERSRTALTMDGLVLGWVDGANLSEYTAASERASR